MNWLSLLQYVPNIIALIAKVQSVYNSSAANTESRVTSTIHTIAPTVVPFLEQAGAQMFPKAAAAIHAAAAALVTFHPDATKWLQEALNLTDNAGLAVDGSYGPKTRAAVEAFQAKHGLVVTGWASDAENSLIGLALSKL